LHSYPFKKNPIKQLRQSFVEEVPLQVLQFKGQSEQKLGVAAKADLPSEHYATQFLFSSFKVPLH
jgi:hypothetical protein